MNLGTTIPLVVDNLAFELYLLYIPSPMPFSKMDLHSHHHAEIHLVLEGRILFSVESQTYEVSAGQAIIIPSMCRHSSVALQPGTTEYSFILDATTRCCRKVQYSQEALAEILRSMKACKKTGQASAMIPWFFRFVADLVLEGHFERQGYIDYPYLIHEYFNNLYARSPSLQELAQQLGISVKQTQRIILKETGHTFTQEVVARRMQAADYLLQQGNMTNEEIAAFVGYQTYAGFWKARKRFLKAKNEGSAQE